MKTLILITSFVISLSAFASGLAPEYIRPEGVYVFSDVVTTQIRDVEIVPTINSVRYRELLAQKYQCMLRGAFYMCQKHSKQTDTPTILTESVKKDWKGRFFEFEKSPHEPDLINESEDLNEWSFYDQVKFEGGHVFEYRYYLLKGENPVHKLALNFLSGKKWLVIKDEKTLLLGHQKVEKESQFKARVYELALAFTYSTH